MGIPWVEKYRPKSLKDIVGNTSAISEMKNWALEWEKGNFPPPLLLVGKPGCGKTSAAKALANDMHWGVIELNASDVRNEDTIKKIALVGAINETFTDEGEFLSSKKGGRKLIIFDEADNLYEGKDDRGGKKAIVETIKVAKQPIILIGNDYYSIVSGTWGAKLRSMCRVIKFRSLYPSQIVKILARICSAEGIKCHREALKHIAEMSGGDLRAAINDLQAIAEGKKILMPEDLRALGLRDEKNEIYEATAVTLRSLNYRHARETSKNITETPDFLLLWVEENMPYEYLKYEDLVNGYEMLSRADVYLGRVIRRQHYALWSYALDLIAGVSVAKMEKYKHHPRVLQFPSWLKDMSRSKQARATRERISTKISKIYHTSPKQVREEILPEFRVIFDRDQELRNLYTEILHLTSEEINMLTETPHQEAPKESKKSKLKKKGEGGSS